MKYISFPLMGFLLLADYTSADSYKKYIPDSVKQYIPEFINEEESMQDSFWSDNWDDEIPSSSVNSSLKDKVLYGPSSLSNVSYHNLTGNGPLKLTHVNVKHSLKVNGPLTGSKIQAAFMEVNGPVKILNLDVEKAVIRGAANLKEAHVKNGLTIYGFLSAQGSIFKKPIHAFSSEIRFKDSQVQAIILEKDKFFPDESPKIHLLGTTQVLGDIEFKGKKGTVEVGPNAKVDGKVINGILQNADNKRE